MKLSVIISIMNSNIEMKLHIKSETQMDGYREIVSPRNGSLKYLTFGLLNLNDHLREYNDQLGDEEAILTLIRGEGSVEIEESTGKKVQYSIGPRKNPFDEKATMVYLPRKTSYRVTSKGSLFELAQHKVPTLEKGHALIINPEEIIPTPTGKDNWRRDVSLATSMDLPIRRLVLGETINAPGNWSSYPPHKHDEENLPVEFPLEEIYYFLLNPSQGFGMMRLYDPPNRKNGLDEAFVIQNGDTVVIPHGYHPVVAAPGYQIYYLFALAGKERHHGTWSDDPAHKWVRNR